MSPEEDDGYRDRLQRRLQMLKEELSAGRVRFPADSQLSIELKKVMELPDGSIDLNSVGSSVRAMALAIEAARNHTERLSKVSLNEIQLNYLEFIKINFLEFYRFMLDHKGTPHSIADFIAYHSSHTSEIYKDIPRFMSTLKEFWNEFGPLAHSHTKSLDNSLKGVFGGDLFPSHTKSIASQVGFYLDTIILPDPFLRSKIIFEASPVERQVYYLIKHGLNILKYQDLISAPISPPIILVLPDLSTLNENYYKTIQYLGNQDALPFAQKIFGRDFSNIDDLIEFSTALTTIDEVVKEVKDQTRALYDDQLTGDLTERLLAISRKNELVDIGLSHPGLIIANQILGRMSVSTELTIKAMELRGYPIIDAPTSWQYFQWKLELDTELRFQGQEQEALHITRGIQSMGEAELPWLGNVPHAALIELRSTGAISELRPILSKGVTELCNSDPTNFKATTDRVFYNFFDAFQQHNQQIEDLKSRAIRFAGSDVGSWLVTGGLAISAAVTSTPSLALLALAATEILPTPKLKDIPSKLHQLAYEFHELKSSPLGMFYSYSKKG